jgi:hypothetical protein
VTRAQVLGLIGIGDGAARTTFQLGEPPRVSWQALDELLSKKASIIYGQGECCRQEIHYGRRRDTGVVGFFRIAPRPLITQTGQPGWLPVVESMRWCRGSCSRWHQRRSGCSFALVAGRPAAL